MQTEVAIRDTIELEDAALLYGLGRGVDGVTLALGAGECLAVLGRNGSGKTTLTRLLTGLARPQRGAVRVLGVDLGAGARPPLGRMGVCLDAPAHWEALSGWDNAWFAARSLGLAAPEAERRLGELFARAGLAAQAREPVTQWSYGMRRKLGLVQALVHDPELLVLDEPAAGVDAPFLVELAELVRDRSRRGQSTWVSGNDPDWVEGVAARVAFLESGRLEALGTVADLTSRVSPLREVTVRLAAAGRVAAPELAGMRSFRQEGATLHALLEADPELVARLLGQLGEQGAEVAGLEVRRSTLRDAFLLATGRGLGEGG